MERMKPFPVKVSEKELAIWRAGAKEYGCSVSEWVRRRCRGPGRLRKARAPKAIPSVSDGTRRVPVAAIASDEAEWPCTHGRPGGVDCPDCEAFDQETAREEIEDRERAERQRAERERWNTAVKECKAAGSVREWFASLPSRVAQEFEDLRADLLKCEQQEKEHNAWLAQQTSPVFPPEPRVPKPSASDGDSRNRTPLKSHRTLDEDGMPFITDGGMIIS
jgi:hypothetical protein